MSLRVVSYNIRYGGVGRETALAATIHGLEPDVVLLQEATRPEAVERIARGAGMPFWGSRRGHSVGYLSRVPVARYAWHALRGSRRTFLELELEGRSGRLCGVHLTAIHSDWTERRRVRELRALLAAIVGHENETIVVGDFNTLAPGEKLDWSKLPRRLKVLAWLGGRAIRWQTIQVMLDAGFLDAFRLKHPDAAGHTFPTWRPHVRLDFVFVPAAWAASVGRCDVMDGDGAQAASDHFPLVAEFSPEPPPSDRG